MQDNVEMVVVAVESRSTVLHLHTVLRLPVSGRGGAARALLSTSNLLICQHLSARDLYTFLH